MIIKHEKIILYNIKGVSLLGIHPSSSHALETFRQIIMNKYSKYTPKTQII